MVQVLMLLLVLMLGGERSYAEDANAFLPIQDVLQIDTVVRIGDADLQTYYLELSASHADSLWLAVVRQDGSLDIVAYGRDGREVVKTSLPGTYFDEATAGEDVDLKGLVLTATYFVIMDYHRLYVIDRPPHGITPGPPKVIMAGALQYDRLYPIDDSHIAGVMWRMRTGVPVTEAGRVGVLDLAALTVHNRTIPFTEGMILAFYNPFSCMTVMGGALIFVNPYRYVLHRLPLLDTTATWQTIARGTMERKDSTFALRHDPGTPGGNSRIMLEHMDAVRRAEGSSVSYVEQVLGRYLLVCRTAPTSSEHTNDITYWDVWDARDPAVPVVVKRCVDQAFTVDTPATSATIPATMVDKYLARPVGNALASIAIFPPLTIDAVRDVSVRELPSYIENSMWNDETFPLSLVRYRFLPPGD